MCDTYSWLEGSKPEAARLCATRSLHPAKVWSGCGASRRDRRARGGRPVRLSDSRRPATSPRPRSRATRSTPPRRGCARVATTKYRNRRAPLRRSVVCGDGPLLDSGRAFGLGSRPSHGAIAQLGERYNGIVKVGGSIPPGSTDPQPVPASDLVQCPSSRGLGHRPFTAVTWVRCRGGAI